VLLGLLLTAIFVLWLLVAETIYLVTLGPEPPASIASFLRDVFTTGAIWVMIGVGVGVGWAGGSPGSPDSRTPRTELHPFFYESARQCVTRADGVSPSE
jgi:hypothetical protein